MLVRTATQADITEMHRLRMSVRENRLLDPASVSLEDYRRLLETDGRGWVAVLDARIAGFAVADLVRANVWALFVDPVREGRGIGRALHDVMLAAVFDAGLQRVWLSTDPGTRAERFYRAAGWRRVGTMGGEARFEMTRQEFAERSGQT